MDMRKCIGSAKFDIEPHEAPVEDFPKQPSQKDGLGRMCRVHWNAYTLALRKAALERKAAEAEGTREQPTPEPSGEEPSAVPEDEQPAKPPRGRRRGAKVEEVGQEGASG